MIDTDNMISVEEDDRITAEEAAKTPKQVNAESLKLLHDALERVGAELDLHKKALSIMYGWPYRMQLPSPKAGESLAAAIIRTAEGG